MNCQFVLTLGVLTICDRWQLEVTTCDTWQCDTVVWSSIAHPHAQAKLTWLHLIPKITKNMPTCSIPRTPNSAVAAPENWWNLQEINKMPPKNPSNNSIYFCFKNVWTSDKCWEPGSQSLSLSPSLSHSLSLTLSHSHSLTLSHYLTWVLHTAS